jgi:[ribosomal protein S18]-alanine N-acetyltransferase
MNDQNIRVDSVGPFDLQVLAILHAACFDDRWDEPAIAALLAMPGAFGLLASAVGLPAGFLLARVAADEAEILSIGVAPDRRRRGVGGHLLERALDCAAGGGGVRVLLEVAEDNIAARAFYLRYGFAVVGRRSGYYRRAAGSPVAALIMSAQTVDRPRSDPRSDL